MRNLFPHLLEHLRLWRARLLLLFPRLAPLHARPRSDSSSAFRTSETYWRERSPLAPHRAWRRRHEWPRSPEELLSRLHCRQRSRAWGRRRS